MAASFQGIKTVLLDIGKVNRHLYEMSCQKDDQLVADDMD